MQTIPNGRLAGTISPRVATRNRVDPVVVCAPLELDVLSGPRLVATVARVVALPPVPDIHLVLERIEFVDVAGVRALLACRDVARMHSVQLRFVDVSPPLERILGIIPELRERFEED